MDTLNINNQSSPILQHTDGANRPTKSGTNYLRSASIEAESAHNENVLSRKHTPLTERKVTDNKKSLSDIINEITVTINYSQPFSFHRNKMEKQLNGASLLEGKYDLRENCNNTCIPLHKALECNKDLKELGYRVGLSVIKNEGDDAITFFDSAATHSISGLIAYTYLLFEHSDSGTKLVLNPAIAATLLRAKPSIMTFSELKDQIRSTLEQKRKERRCPCYSHPAGGFMPQGSALAINRYIFNADQASELESATDLLFNAMYGENVNPKGCSENEQDGLPIDQRRVTPY